MGALDDAVEEVFRRAAENLRQRVPPNVHDRLGSVLQKASTVKDLRAAVQKLLSQKESNVD
jgi:hypothetical protein